MWVFTGVSQGRVDEVMMREESIAEWEEGPFSPLFGASPFYVPPFLLSLFSLSPLFLHRHQAHSTQVKNHTMAVHLCPIRFPTIDA
jgi:hypothetical protein